MELISWEEWVTAYAATGVIISLVGLHIFYMAETTDWNEHPPGLWDYISYFIAVVPFWPIWVVVVLFDAIKQIYNTNRK